jgi:hypothetical protein
VRAHHLFDTLASTATSLLPHLGQNGWPLANVLIVIERVALHAVHRNCTRSIAFTITVATTGLQ